MTEFTPLDVDDMMAAYRRSKNRVILFDYGGSLLEKEVSLFTGRCSNLNEKRGMVGVVLLVNRVRTLVGETWLYVRISRLYRGFGLLSRIKYENRGSWFGPRVFPVL